jgi:hypothetical protein
MSEPGWPEFPPKLTDAKKAEYQRARYDAELEARKKALELRDTRLGADEEAENQVNQAFFEAVFEVAKGSISPSSHGHSPV